MRTYPDDKGSTKALSFGTESEVRLQATKELRPFAAVWVRLDYGRKCEVLLVIRSAVLWIRRSLTGHVSSSQASSTISIIESV